MATVQDVIQRAGRKIGLNDMTAEELADGLAAFNEMLAGWRTQGVDVWRSDSDDGMINVEAAVPELGLADELPFPAAFREGAIYILASRMAPEYSSGFDADAFMRRMQAHYMTIRPVEFPNMLRIDWQRRWPWL